MNYIDAHNALLGGIYPSSGHQSYSSRRVTRPSHVWLSGGFQGRAMHCLYRDQLSRGRHDRRCSIIVRIADHTFENSIWVKVKLSWPTVGQTATAQAWWWSFWGVERYGRWCNFTSGDVSKKRQSSISWVVLLHFRNGWCTLDSNGSIGVFSFWWTWHCDAMR